MSNEGKIRVPVTDKNGKRTHVWKTQEEIKADAANASRVGSVAPVNAAPPVASDAVKTEHSAWAGTPGTSVKNPFAGHADWKHNVDLRALAYPDLTLEDRADVIVTQIEASDWMRDNEASGDNELRDALDSLQDAGASGDSDHFDAVWNSIYNLADTDHVWLETL